MNVQKGSEIIKVACSEHGKCNTIRVFCESLTGTRVVDEAELQEMLNNLGEPPNIPIMNITQWALLKEILGVVPDRVKVVKKFKKKPISVDESKW